MNFLNIFASLFQKTFNELKLAHAYRVKYASKATNRLKVLMNPLQNWFKMQIYIRGTHLMYIVHMLRR